MAKASRYLAGKYLNVETVEAMEPAERIVTISHVAEEEIANRDKLVLYFDGVDSGLPLNNTRIEQMIAICDQNDDTDGWRGKKVELFIDPHVRMGGKKVGGVAIRAAQST